jgi:type I restriction enzyme S subunit
MTDEWRELPLSALADLSGGFAFKSQDYAPAGRFILRTLNIREDGSISRDDAVYLPKESKPCD